MADDTKQLDPNVIGATVPEGSDAEADAYLEAHPAAPDEPVVEGTDASPRARDEQGRFTKTDTQVSEDTAEPLSADTVNPEDYRKALNALRRDNTPQEVLDRLEPPEVIEWGLKQARKQAESDGYGKQLTDLKEQLAAVVKADSPPAEPAYDIDAKLKPLQETFGDEIAAPLKALLEPLVTAATQTQSSETGKVDKVAAQLTSMLQRDARREIQAAWPEYGLDKDDRWERLLASRRGDTTEYPTEREALDTHRRLVFADEIHADHRLKLKETHEARDNGQPARPAGTTPPAAETPEALEDRYLNAMHDGNQAEMDRIKGVIKAREAGGYMSFDELMTKIG